MKLKGTRDPGHGTRDPQRVDMDCDKVKERLALYFYGESGGETRAIKAHLKKCPVCRSEFAELKQVGKLADGMEIPPVGDGEWVRFADNVRQGIVSRPLHGRFLRPLVLWPALAAAAAAFILHLQFTPAEKISGETVPVCGDQLALAEDSSAEESAARVGAAAEFQLSEPTKKQAPRIELAAQAPAAMEKDEETAQVVREPEFASGETIDQRPLGFVRPGAALPGPAAMDAAGTTQRPVAVASCKDGKGDDAGDIPRPEPTASATPLRDRIVLKNNKINPLLGDKATIVYRLPEGGRVRLAVYNSLGELMLVLYQGERNAGTFEEYWEGANRAGAVVSAGIYFVSIETPSYNERRKIVVVK